MNEYQELFNKITKEIASKRKELPNLKEEIDKSSERYNKLIEEITSIQESLDEKQKETEELLHSKDNKTFYKTYIPGVLLVLIPTLIMALFSVQLIAYLRTLYVFVYILTGFLTCFIGIILPSVIGVLILRKIFLKKLKKSHDEVMSSSEYQNLLKEIHKIENNLSVKKSLQRTEEKTIDDTKTEYNLALTEIKMKETLLEYLKSESKTSLININNEVETEIQKDTKPIKRTRKKIK